MKPPKPLDIDDSLVDNAVTHWREGKVVAIPTETVYGLAADATNGEAVARIYALKGRPSFNPLIVHVLGVEAARRHVVWNETAGTLARCFWPGPLTLVLKKDATSAIHDLVSAGGDTLAVRAPSHPVARRLLEAFGGPLAAPSANRSGRISPTMAAHVRAEFGDVLPLVLEGGACEVGLESTVLDLTEDTPRILRPGAITKEMLEHTGVILRSDGDFVDAASRTSQHFIPKSPGLLTSHYAPSLPVRLSATHVHSDEALLAFGSNPLTGAARMLNLSERGDLIEAAANLFAHLRALDDPRLRAIAVMPIPREGIGAAIHDRLARASA